MTSHLPPRPRAAAWPVTPIGTLLCIALVGCSSGSEAPGAAISGMPDVGLVADLGVPPSEDTGIRLPPPSDPGTPSDRGHDLRADLGSNGDAGDPGAPDLPPDPGFDEGAADPGSGNACGPPGTCEAELGELGPCEEAACVGGACVAKTVPAGMPCVPATDTLDPACVSGVCSGKGECIVVVSPGVECDDGDLCTLVDQCNLVGKCEGVAVVCESEDPCEVGACDPESGACATAPVDDGSVCDDGSDCTLGETCQSGVCKGGQNLCPCVFDSDCPDDGDLCNGTMTCVHAPDSSSRCEPLPDSEIVCTGDPGLCAELVCEPATGLCEPQILVAMVCDDGDPCTEGDICDAAGECAGAATDCNDGNPCTADACDASAGGCVHTFKDGGPCDDDDLCTDDDICSGGDCTGVQKSCDDGEVCTVDACGAAGQCVHEPAPAGFCDDGDPCTEDDACGGGHCTGAPVLCPAGGPCTAGRCEAGFGCVVDPVVDTLCDDGDPCTVDEVCTSEGCVGAPASCDDKIDCTVDACVAGSGCASVPKPGACDDGNPCTADTCDPEKGGCVHAPVPLDCDDGDACTAGDACVSGACLGAPVACNDGVSCTLDGCDPSSGCTAVADDTACDDGSPCTVDTCDLVDGCIHPPATGVICDDGDPCTGGDACLEGVCQGLQPVCECNVDADCDDGNACNGVFSCTADQDGVLRCVQQQPPVACPPSALPCYKEVCAPATGICGPVKRKDGTVCIDDNPCTTAELCLDGACVTQPTDCLDGVPCTLDGCDPASGCFHTPRPGECSDGLPCTADACVPGQGCVHNADSSLCDDGVSCTVDTCSLSSGCLFSPDAALCDDGLPCTADGCDLVTDCAHVPVDLVCEDGNPCTADACQPGVGCVHTPAPGSCSDNNPCTFGDACSQGQCAPGPPANCDDGNPCTVDSCDPTAGGCVHTPATGATPCEDGDPCTVSDTCDGATCTAGGPRICDDGIACTQDSCQAGTGCVFAPDWAACDDGNPCTDDLCVLGQGCTHGPKPSFTVCDDGFAATAPDVCVAGACKGFQQRSVHPGPTIFPGCKVVKHVLRGLSRFKGNVFVASYYETGPASLCGPATAFSRTFHLVPEVKQILVPGSWLMDRRWDQSYDLTVSDHGVVGRLVQSGASYDAAPDVGSALSGLGEVPGDLHAVWATDLRTGLGGLFSEEYFIAGRTALNKKMFLARCIRSPAQAGVACELLDEGIGGMARKRINPVAADGLVVTVPGCLSCPESVGQVVLASNDTDGTRSIVLVDPAGDLSQVALPAGTPLLRGASFDEAGRVWLVGDSGFAARHDQGVFDVFDPPAAIAGLRLSAVFARSGAVIMVGTWRGPAGNDPPEGVLLALDQTATAAQPGWRLVPFGKMLNLSDVLRGGIRLQVVGDEPDTHLGRSWFLDL